jgi:hypothetical protein
MGVERIVPQRLLSVLEWHRPLIELSRFGNRQRRGRLLWLSVAVTNALLK